MWAGFYIVALGLMLLGIKINIDKTDEKISINIKGNIIGRTGYYLIGIITIAYGISLIINN
jgi:hypothetical protein